MDQNHNALLGPSQKFNIASKLQVQWPPSLCNFPLQVLNSQKRVVEWPSVAKALPLSLQYAQQEGLCMHGPHLYWLFPN